MGNAERRDRAYHHHLSVASAALRRLAERESPLACELDEHAVLRDSGAGSVESPVAQGEGLIEGERSGPAPDGGERPVYWRMRFPRPVVLTAIAFFAFPAAALAVDAPDYTKIFQGRDGCFELYDLTRNKVVARSNDKQCAERSSPCSTFKVSPATSNKPIARCGSTGAKKGVRKAL